METVLGKHFREDQDKINAEEMFVSWISTLTDFLFVKLQQGSILGQNQLSSQGVENSAFPREKFGL